MEVDNNILLTNLNPNKIMDKLILDNKYKINSNINPPPTTSQTIKIIMLLMD